MSGCITHYSRPWNANRQCRVRHCVTQYNSILINHRNRVPIYPNTGGACVVSFDISWWCVWSYNNKVNFYTSKDLHTQLSFFDEIVSFKIILLLVGVLLRSLKKTIVIIQNLKETSWPTREHVGLAIRWSWVRVPLYRLAGFFPGRP